MKKCLLFCFVLVFSVNLSAQILKFDFNGRIPKYEEISVDGNYVLGKPVWEKKSNESWNFFDSGYTYIPVLEKHMDKWEKKLAKTCQCNITKFPIDTSLYVIKYNFAKHNILPGNLEQQTQQMLNNSNNLLTFYHFLCNNDRFKYTVGLNDVLQNKFGLKASKALTNVSTPIDRNYNGVVAIKFYGDDPANPIGYFQGFIKNGEANGYGMLIQPYLFDNKPFLTSAVNEDRLLFGTRIGFWKDGVFVEEQNAQAMVDQTVEKLMKTEFAKFVPSGLRFRKEIISEEYKIDKFCPNYSNGFSLTYNLIWEDARGVNGGRSVLLCLRETYEDFTAKVPKYEVLKADDVTFKKIVEDENKPLSLSSIIVSLNDARRNEEVTSLYDDYTLITTSPWYESATACKYEMQYDGYGNELGRRPVDWIYESDCYVSVSVRKKRDAPWQPVNKYVIKETVNCMYTRRVTVEPADGRGNAKVIDGSNEGIDYIAKVTKLDFPDPLNDTSKSSLQIASADMFNILVKRMGSSSRYQKRDEDILAGAWYDPETERIYLVDDSKAEEMFCIEKSSGNLVGGKGYTEAVRKLFRKSRNDKSFIIEAQIDFYSGPDLHLNDYQKNKPNKGINIHESHTIAKIDGNILNFDDGGYWERIVPTDAFIAKMQKANEQISGKKKQIAEKLKNIPAPSAPSKTAIGQNYGGGIVVYIYQPGEKGYVANEVHGLVAYPQDFRPASWNDAMYTCDALRSDNYDDWRLPTTEELNILVQNQGFIGRLTGYEYWSSDEFNSNQAFQLNQRYGKPGYFMVNKSQLCYVRAVRNF